MFLLLSKPLKLLAKLNVTRLGFCPSFRRFCKSLLTFGINSRFLSTRCHFFLISRKTISDSSMLLCYICNPYICNPCLYLLFNASIIFEFINSLHQSKLLFITSFLKGPAKNKTKNLNLTSLRKLSVQNKRVVQQQPNKRIQKTQKFKRRRMNKASDSGFSRDSSKDFKKIFITPL